MKKLDNKGWGLVVFLIFIFIFFFTILLISFLANKNGIGPQDTNNNYNNIDTKDYTQFETKVKISAMKYQEMNYPNIENGDIFYINISKLELSDEIKNSCTGYVKLGKVNGNYIYEPYLSCDNYTTSGYTRALDN